MGTGTSVAKDATTNSTWFFLLCESAPLAPSLYCSWLDSRHIVDSYSTICCTSCASGHTRLLEGKLKLAAKHHHSLYSGDSLTLRFEAIQSSLCRPHGLICRGPIQRLPELLPLPFKIHIRHEFRRVSRLRNGDTWVVSSTFGHNPYGHNPWVGFCGHKYKWSNICIK